MLKASNALAFIFLSLAAKSVLANDGLPGRSLVECLTTQVEQYTKNALFCGWDIPKELRTKNFILRFKGEEVGKDRWSLSWDIESPEQEYLGNLLLYRDPKNPEIGLEIAPHARNRRVASEAEAALLQFAFEKPSVTMIKARVDADNEASLRLQQKLGFELTGVVGTPEEPLAQFQLTRERLTAALSKTSQTPVGERDYPFFDIVKKGQASWKNPEVRGRGVFDRLISQRTSVTSEQSPGQLEEWFRTLKTETQRKLEELQKETDRQLATSAKEFEGKIKGSFFREARKMQEPLADLLLYRAAIVNGDLKALMESDTPDLAKVEKYFDTLISSPDGELVRTALKDRVRDFLLKLKAEVDVSDKDRYFLKKGLKVSSER
jgi:hypothetical protein